MTKLDEILLNAVFLKNRIAELGIKQWWLAEQIGVERKTVVRWVQGKVKSIHLENATALTQILKCELADLTSSNEADQLATPEDQKKASALLVQSSLIDKLGPIGEWNVIESLLKASIIPNLPLSVLGELYNQLTTASWRQSKLEQAHLYNQKAEELAHRSGDKGVLAGALLSKANLLSWRGKTAQSIRTYQECLALEPFIEPKTIGSTLSNLGSVLYEAGDLDTAEEYQKKAIENFTFNGKPMNLSIAWCGLAMIGLEKNDSKAVIGSIDKSEEFAKQDDYFRGINMCKLLRAELSAKQGLKDNSVKLLQEGLEGFSQLKINEGLNFEYAGRINRILGNYEISEPYLRQGLAISTDLPIYQAGLLFELAKTLRLKSPKSKEIKQCALNSKEIYLLCEAPIRAELVDKFINSLT